MKQLREQRVILGTLVWLALVSLGVLAFRDASAKAPGGMTRLIQYASNQSIEVSIEFDQPQWIAVGDLVFRANQSDYAPIGFVSRAGDNRSRTKDILYTDQATVTFYANAPSLSANDYLAYHQPSNDTAWVIETMLPPAKRDELTRLILNAYARESEMIVEAMRPIVAKSLSEAGAILKEDLLDAFDHREDQFRVIGEKYQSEIVEQQLVPLVKQEIWPIVQTESESLAMQIGQEVWREVSVFRFAWRYVYDRSLDPDLSLTRRELSRFLEQKVAPILESHADDMVAVQNRIVAKVARNERVQDTMLSAARTISSDPELQLIVSEIFQEVLVKNIRLRESLQKNWNSPEAIAALEFASARLEPTINNIGVALFGSPDDKITPEFARVLRHRILNKDSRWLTLHLAQATSTPTVRPNIPAKLPVVVADPTGEIPYAPARKR